MRYENIATEVGEDRVAKITLYPPDQLNALNTQMAEELDKKAAGRYLRICGRDALLRYPR